MAQPAAGAEETSKVQQEELLCAIASRALVSLEEFNPLDSSNTA